MACDRTELDFSKEIRSLYLHEEVFARPRLGMLTNSIYVPKFKAKCFSSYFYAGETEESYNNYHYSCNKNTIFNHKDRSRTEMILGIESSFDDSAASLVNSYGEIKGAKIYT